MSGSNLPPPHSPHLPWRGLGDDATNNPVPLIIQDGSTGVHIPTHSVAPIPGGGVGLSFEDLALGESKRSVRMSGSLYNNSPPMSPNTVYSAVADSILEEGVLTGRTNQIYGFEAEDLLYGNAIYCSPCRPSSLTAPTLKIFHPHNFIDTPDDTYRAIAPALALAEKIILQGNSEFFINLVSGTRVIDEQLSMQQGTLMYRLHPPPNEASTYFDALVDLLENMGDRIQWRFEYQDMLLGEYHTIWLPRRAVVPAWGAENPSTRMINITLHNEFYDLARAFSVMQWPNEAQKLRFDFYLAVIICHELAHAIDGAVSDTWWSNYCDTVLQTQGPAALARLPQRTQETLLGEFDTVTEMGAHFEIQTFGGRMLPFGDLLHVKYGLLLFNGGMQPYADSNWGSNIRLQIPNALVIPMTYMEELQQEYFWTRRDIVRSLVIPYSRLTTLDGLMTTTVSWRDHLLDVEAERRLANQTNPPSIIGVKRRASTTLLPATTKRIMTQMPSDGDQTMVTGSMNPSTLGLGLIRRFAQMPIRRYVSSTNVDEAELHRDTIMAALRDKWQASQRQGQAYAAAEARRAYVAPEPGQTNIHDFFRYNGESDSSSSSQSTIEAHDYHSPTYDALQIPSHRLKIADKWILLEEFSILSLGWDTPTFLARRRRQELGFISRQCNPEVRTSWSDTERRTLYGLRLANPGRSWPEQRDARRQQQRHRRDQMRIYNEMEELATLKGYSRIQFNIDFAKNSPLPMGMTMSNFDSVFRYQLLTERALLQLQNSDPDPNDEILLSPSYDPTQANRPPLSPGQSRIMDYISSSNA